jgi:hypothetical protein
MWQLIPAAGAIMTAMAIVARSVPDPRKFVLGVLIGFSLAAAAIFWPGFNSEEEAFRRATIAERYFKPANRIEAFRTTAQRTGNWIALRRVNDAEWNIADVRAYAPNDFPYLPPSARTPAPNAVVGGAVEKQRRGDLAGAEKILSDGKTQFPFAACAFGSNLAVIYYSTNRKDLALRELESIQPLVNRASRAECQRSQYLLGSLYQESNRTADADRTFRAFISNTEGTTDPELQKFRKSLTGK